MKKITLLEDEMAHLFLLGHHLTKIFYVFGIKPNASRKRASLSWKESFEALRSQRYEPTRKAVESCLSKLVEADLVESYEVGEGGVSVKLVYGGSSKKSSSTATRLPDDWVMPQDWIEWAESRYPHIDIEDNKARFTNHFKSASDPKVAKKSNWFLTWQNWMHNEAKGRYGKPTIKGEVKTPLPKDWRVPKKWVEWARHSLGLDENEVVVRSLEYHASAIANGRISADWFEDWKAHMIRRYPAHLRLVDRRLPKTEEAEPEKKPVVFDRG